jgi:hypothetical protein
MILGRPMFLQLWRGKLPIGKPLTIDKNTWNQFLFHKVLNNETAPNLKEIFLKQTDLVLPVPTSEFKKNTFSYSGATIWNNYFINYCKTIQFYELFQKTNQATFSRAIIM